MPNLFGRPLWSYLPFGSVLYYDSDSITMFLFHFGYALGGIFYLMAYPMIALDTGAFDPINQIKIYRQQSQRREELTNKIFGPGGFADTNFDKTVDINEKANAYKKLGLKDFPKEDLTLEQLEELVKKYMN